MIINYLVENLNEDLYKYTNLNNLVPGTEFEGKSVEEIVATAPDGPIFNNAGQVLNHTYYFLQFAGKPQKSEPCGKLAEAINKEWGSFENFKKEFTAAAVGLFGSGWAWLSVDKDGKFVSTKDKNASVFYSKLSTGFGRQKEISSMAGTAPLAGEWLINVYNAFGRKVQIPEYIVQLRDKTVVSGG